MFFEEEFFQKWFPVQRFCLNFELKMYKKMEKVKGVVSLLLIPLI